MKKPSKKKLSFALTALLVLFLLSAYAWYTRPVTLPALYPMLKPEQCTQIQGYYEIGMQPEQSNFTITKDSAEFEQLWDLFYDQSYRRSLKDLLPRGTRIHRTEEDDFQWTVDVLFEDIAFPDGSTGSGTMLHFTYWYGTFELFFDGETHIYRVPEPERRAAQVLAIIQ